MGIYTDNVVKKSTAEASNVGAVTTVIGKVATTIASIGAMAGGGAMASAGASAGNVAKAQVGQQIQKMGFQMIGRNVGGFSGIVIASNMADAYQQYNYKTDIDNAIKENKEMEKQAKSITNIPANALRKQFSQSANELKRRKKEGEPNGR